MTDQAPIRWQPDRATPPVSWPVPKLTVALGRGLRMVCPACGGSKLFAGYLTVRPVCPRCGAPLGLARADDAPPYFTIAIVAHVVIGGMVWLERAYQPPLWVHTAIWVPLTVVLSLLLLRPIKGATVGLMLRLGLLKTGDEA